MCEHNCGVIAVKLPDSVRDTEDYTFVIDQALEMVIICGNG